MNDDFRDMKFIYLHCGEETKLRDLRRVRNPYGPEFFSGPIFNHLFGSVLSCEDLISSIVLRHSNSK